MRSRRRNRHRLYSVVALGLVTVFSIVAMSSNRARAIGVEYVTSEERATVTTAQGEALSYIVTLDEVDVGGIRAYNVKAAIIEGAYPIDVLLGMSYLRHVEMQESAGVLRLERKY